MDLWCSQGGYHVHPTKDMEPEILGFVDKCAKYGVTRLFPTIVRSDYMPRLINFEDEASYRNVPVLRDFYAEWHPMRVLTQEARRFGIEVHPYLNVNHHGSAWPNWQSPLPSPLAVIGTSKFASEHRRYWKRDRQGRDSFEVAKHIQCSPAFDEVRAYERGQIKESIDICRPDGVQLEFTVDPLDSSGVSVYGYDLPLLAEFEEIYGYSPLIADNGDDSWIEMRCRPLTCFVRELKSDLGRMNSNLKLSVTVIAAESRDYVRRLQDWPTWVQEGLIDEVHLWFRKPDLDAVQRFVEDGKALTQNRCRLLVELSCYHAEAMADPRRLVEAAMVAKDAGADQAGIYRADVLEAKRLWPVLEQIQTLYA